MKNSPTEKRYLLDYEVESHGCLLDTNEITSILTNLNIEVTIQNIKTDQSGVFQGSCRLNC